EIELARLLGQSITFESHQDEASTNDHFFEVVLSGLARAPATLTDVTAVRDYLAETAPVDFEPDWTRGEAIEADYRSYFGNAIETVDVFVSAEDETVQIRKPYSDQYEFAKGTAELVSVDFWYGDDNTYWGWVGRLSESAAVTDWRTRGLRIRLRNIQVGGN